MRLVIPRNQPNAAAWLYGERALSADESQRFCAQAGGELARVTSAADMAAIVKLLSSALGPRSSFAYNLTAQAALWFGLVKKGDAGNWTWRDDSPLTGYSNWAGYEPSNWGPCSVLGWFWTRRTAWYAYPCAWSNMALPFLCRLPADAELPAGGVGGARVGGEGVACGGGGWGVAGMEKLPPGGGRGEGIEGSAVEIQRNVGM